MHTNLSHSKLLYLFKIITINTMKGKSTSNESTKELKQLVQNSNHIAKQLLCKLTSSYKNNMGISKKALKKQKLCIKQIQTIGWFYNYKHYEKEHTKKCHFFHVVTNIRIIYSWKIQLPVVTTTTIPTWNFTNSFIRNVRHL